MGLVVTLFLALAAMTVSYAFGQGGPVAGLVFFAVLFIGAAIRVCPAEVLTAAAPQARVAITSRYSASSTSARSPAVFSASRNAAGRR